jgi:hypothetical protein
MTKKKSRKKAGTRRTKAKGRSAAAKRESGRPGGGKGRVDVVGSSGV